MRLWRPPEKTEFGAVSPGPVVVSEFFEALRDSGKRLIHYDSGWRTRSGVVERGAGAKFRTSLQEGLRHTITMDHLDPVRLHSAEYLTRWVLLIESVTQKNSRQPD